MTSTRKPTTTTSAVKTASKPVQAKVQASLPSIKGATVALDGSKFTITCDLQALETLRESGNGRSNIHAEGTNLNKITLPDGTVYWVSFMLGSKKASK